MPQCLDGLSPTRWPEIPTAPGRPARSQRGRPPASTRLSLSAVFSVADLEHFRVLVQCLCRPPDYADVGHESTGGGGARGDAVGIVTDPSGRLQAVGGTAHVLGMFQVRTQAQSPSPHTGAVTSSCMNAVNTCNPVRTANANAPFPPSHRPARSAPGPPLPARCADSCRRPRLVDLPHGVPSSLRCSRPMSRVPIAWQDSGKGRRLKSTRTGTTSGCGSTRATISSVSCLSWRRVPNVFRVLARGPRL